MNKEGYVVAVCISWKGGVPKYSHSEVLMTEFGLDRDYHTGPTRISRSTGHPKFNDRQINLFAEEVYDDLNKDPEIGPEVIKKFGLPLVAGDFGENILTRGLGDLSDLTPGALLKIGQAIVLEITEQNKPCENLQVYHRLMVRKTYGRRGVFAIVKNGAGSVIKPCDLIRLVPDTQIKEGATNA